jgi:thiamine-phosphate pyrophosphorylase
LADGGAALIQIREKHAPAGELLVEVRRALSVAGAYGVRIVINDRADIALAAGADGVHLGQDDLPPAAARKLLGDDAIIGFSTHTLEQVRAAAGLPVDYIAFGPVFSTNTKDNADPTVDPNLLKEARLLTRGRPLVAIGGIDDANLSAVFGAGADSAAVISALISEASQIEQRMRELFRISELYR